MSTIQSITDALLIEAIDLAEHRVVMIAPGVWPPLAKAIASAWRRLGPNQVSVILDIDPEICRFGYGSLDGLIILQDAAKNAGDVVAEEPGVRICVFIVDDQTFVFSPTPRQLEAQPGEAHVAGAPQPKANGIVLGKPPASLENDLGAGPDGFGARTLGLDTLNNDKLAKVTKDLEKNPAKPFDLAQAVIVYNAKIQFVEFKVTGCRLSEHKARLPPHLLHVLKRNPDLSKKIENSIRLLESDDALVKDPELSQETVFKHREIIEKMYLRPVKGIGTVIERSEKPEFAKDVEELKTGVAAFAKRVEQKLADNFRETAERLSRELLDDVCADIPPKWERKLSHQPDPEQVRWLIFEDLLHAFGDPAKKVERMKVETIFKDVTYDMLNDPDFRIEINEHFPDLPLLEEYSAAKERPHSTKGSQNP
jgi:hypothetical protein